MMKTFTVLISPEETEQILERPEISQEDRLRIQSYTPYTLAEALNDSQQSELYNIDEVELRNLRVIFNIATCVFVDTRIAERFWETSDGKIALPEVKRSYSELERECLKIFLPCWVFATRGIANHNVKFKGNVPKKLLSFRQNRAQEWLNNLTRHIFMTASKIAVKSEKEEALAYILGVTAYYLNKSQPHKYNKQNNNNDINNAISAIINTFLDETDLY